MTSCAVAETGTAASLRWGRIIARTLTVAVVLAALTACTATRMAYQQAPNLLHWWMDRQVDFTGAQSSWVRDDLSSFFAWHRREELPRIADRLRAWQGLARTNPTHDEFCREADAVVEHLQRLGEQAVPSLTRLALDLQPGQIEHLQGRQAKSNDEFAEEFLDGSPRERLQRRLDKAIDRAEWLYGRLSPEQRDLMRRELQASPFDPQRTQAERQRRQRDLIDTVRQAQANPARAEALVRAYLQRMSQSPTPGYDDYTQAQLRHGCAQFATLQATATPTQRDRAAKRLQELESDARSLSAVR